MAQGRIRFVITMTKRIRTNWLSIKNSLPAPCAHPRLTSEPQTQPLQEYLAHKKQPPSPRAARGPKAYFYCRVLGGGGFS